MLRAEGVPYSAQAEVCEMYFPTRTYDTGSLPAGKYRTLRVTLGAAEGKNWWCVSSLRSACRARATPATCPRARRADRHRCERFRGEIQGRGDLQQPARVF